MKLLKLQVLPFVLTLAGLLCPASLYAQLSFQGQEQVVSYSGSTAFILTQVPVNPNLLVNTGTNTFILAVNPPSNSARIYITNDTSNACAAGLTLSLASTGNSGINSFNGNINAFQQVQLTSPLGVFSTTSSINLPANGTIATTSVPIIGSRIAIFLVLSSGCAGTTVDMQVVFGTFTPLVSAVQGVVAPGAPLGTINPLAIGGKSQAGNTSGMYSVAQTTDTQGTSYNSMPIGGISNVNAQGTYNGVTLPKDTTQGPLLAVLDEPDNVTGVVHPLAVSTAVINTANSNAPGLFTTNTGYHKAQVAGPLTVTAQTFGLVTPPGFGAYSSCYITLQVVGVTGTSPTMDVYFQTSSIDNTTFTDRIHFAQFTLSGGTQYAGISGISTGITPANVQDRVLAAGTKIDGPIPAYMRFIVVITGTSPSFPITYGLDCT